MISFFSLPGYGLSSNTVPASISDQPLCDNEAISAASALGSDLNSQSAVATAEVSSLFTQAVGSSKSSFSGLTSSFHFNPNDCSQLTLQNVAVDFTIPNKVIQGCGAPVPEGIQIIEASDLLHVSSVQTDDTVNCRPSSSLPSRSSLSSSNIVSSSTYNGPTYWSGYGVWDTSNGQQQLVTYSTLDFYQPYIYPANACYVAPLWECALSIWTGITSGGQNSVLAQDGTSGTVYCSYYYGCNDGVYSAWWELFPQNAQQNCPQTMSLSDSMEAVAENGNGLGNPSDTWQFYVLDNTQNWVCQASYTYSTSNLPNTALSVWETPTVNGYIVPLPDFSPTDTTNNIMGIVSQSYYDFNTLYNQGMGSPYLMDNYCNGQLVDNIILGALDSSNQFGSTYNTSCGTGNEAYPLTMSVSPSGGGTVSPASGGYYAVGSQVQISASPNSGSGYYYSFTGWTGSGSGSYNGAANPATVTINSPISETANFQYHSLGCVLSGTLVTLADGSSIPVQDLKVGQQILSYDLQSGSLITNYVTSNNSTQVNQVININNGQLYASGLYDQPIYVSMQNGTQEWVLLSQLKVGMKMLDPLTHSWITIHRVKIIDGSFTVYDVRVTGAPNNNYIGNGILVDDKLP